MGTLIALGKDLIYTSGGGPSPTPTPDGKIVIPINDVTIWQECAGITEGYSTMADILADSAMLLLLMGDDNAVDYMVRSTDFISDITSNQNAMNDIGLNNYAANTLLESSDWIDAVCTSSYFESVLNTKVPVMTSNTIPSGSCFASSTYSGRNPYNAFDNVSGNFWMSTNTTETTPQYLGYEFDKKVKVVKFHFYGFTWAGGSGYPRNYSVQGYDDETNNWVDIASYTSNSSMDVTKIFINANDYQKYRIYGTLWVLGNDDRNRAGLQTLQFYGRADV